MTWREFWNADTPIYVSRRHSILHYQLLAGDLCSLMRERRIAENAVVFDYGCGEALSADVVARNCARLILCDAAPLVRQRLRRRFADDPKIAVIDPDEAAALPDRSFDLIVANSVVQYLDQDEFRALLALFEAKLAPNGTLALGDVIAPGSGPLTDAAALLSFGWRGGFLVAALRGLVRTAFSGYRRLRGELGLAAYSEARMIDLLAGAGFRAERRRRNLGHDQARMTFLAWPAGRQPALNGSRS